MLTADGYSPAVAGDSGHARAAAPGWIVFSCGGYSFGVPLGRAREIRTPMPATRLPGCGAEVYGLIALRGLVVTVFDFGAALGVGPSRLAPDHRLVLIEYAGRLVGIAVDSVLGMAPAGLQAIAPSAEALPANRLDPEDLLGSGVLGEAVFAAVDPDRVLARFLGGPAVEERPQQE